MSSRRLSVHQVCRDRRFVPWISAIVSFVLLIGLLPPTKVSAETADEPVVYRFLDAFSGTGNLTALGVLTAPPVTTRNAAYGAAIGARAVGQSRSFQFAVAKTGTYSISFKGYLYFSAGIGQIAIDGTTAGTYDFYDPGSRFGPVVVLAERYLEAGNHTVTFTVTGRNRSATVGDNYSMYASELILTPVEPKVLLAAAPAKTGLTVGETASIRPYVSMSDGTPVTVTGVTYVSSAPAVAAISAEGTVTALSVGTAVVTTTAATNRGIATADASIRVSSNAALQGVRIDLSPDEMYPGAVSQIALIGTLADQTTVELPSAAAEYRVDDPSVAAVSPQGTLKGLAFGETVLRAVATWNGATVEGYRNVTVGVRKPSSLKLEAAPLTVTVSQYGEPKLTGLYGDGTEAALTGAHIVYASSDEQTLAVDAATGAYRGVRPGIAELKATVATGGVTLNAAVPVTVTALTSDKTRSTYYTPQKVANARQNASGYDWAASVRSAAITAADVYVNLDPDFLWNLVAPQSIPRSYGVNQAKGSPVTGKEIDKYGNYPYTADPINEPWKIVDPSSGYKFPTNDFGAYYASGLDKHGTFRPELADRSLLVNTLYPEKGPTWGVDDGYGWVDGNGDTYTFVAYYAHWFLWHTSGFITNAITTLRDAYLYTGDVKYARAGLILLDRVADVYPELDTSVFDPKIFLQSAGGTGTGKAIGSIWETSTVKAFVSAYDAFFPATDDAQTIAFLSAKGSQYKLSRKDSATGIRRNIEDGILRQVYPGVKKSQIRGNVGMHQSALAMAAVVLDTMPEIGEWLDFNNRSGGLVSNPWRVTGGNVLTSLVNDVDRDGHGNEAAPGYNRLWLGNFIQAADILYGYDKYPMADLYQNIKFRSMFDSMYPLLLSERYVPSIGDSDSTGNPSLTGLDKAQAIRAFEIYGDPIFAQMAYFLNNDTTDGIHGDIFSEDPGSVAAGIRAVIDEKGPLVQKSVNLTGYGFSALRDGENDKTKYGIGYGFPQLGVTEATTAYNTYEASGTVQLEATTAGQRIAFAFEVEKPGTYFVRLKPFRAASYGIYNVYIDGVFVKRIDFFGSSKDEETLAELALAAGSHTIRFENEGKSPTASNFKMGVTSLRLLTADELERVEKQRNTLRDTWMYYGRSSGHGHRDTLNLGLHAYGLDLAPDLGYPEFADSVDMHRAQWVTNTISHNTVVVNKRKQNSQFVGIPVQFDETDRVKWTEIGAPRVYPQTETYRRTTAMIRVDDDQSYTVDFFHVKGGTDHHYSFHSAEGTVTTEGLTLTAQPTGTYAGPGVAFGERADDVAGAGYMGSGFHWLKNVERTSGAVGPFSVDWNVRDTWNVLGQGARANTDIHLRLTMLGATDEVALADGVPPRNKPGNPPELRYMIARRSGQNLDSLFTSVIEPYKGQRYISAIEQAEVKKNGVVVQTEQSTAVRAVKVTLVGGRIDYVMLSSDPGITYTIDDKIEFRGAFGVYAEKDGKTDYLYAGDGASIGKIGETPLVSNAAATGKVIDFTKELSLANTIDVELQLHGTDPGQLAERMVYIANDGERNAVYPIRAVTGLGGNRYRLDIGDKTTVRGYVDANDFGKGYVYDLAAGASLRIPLSAEASFGEKPVTLADIASAIDGYRSGGGLNPVFADQLAYRLAIIELLIDRGETATAVAYMNDLLAQIRDLSVRQQGLISEAAFGWLEAAALAWIESVSP
ncbi:heparinase II/III family protein [Paenibacillus hodogayensis]|uniref:Heparinase II/III family protein n=1 Tax=Paenibacillus hodogayensis TaxID=279208 RepID=A0ABV5VTE3_9BACL